MGDVDELGVVVLAGEIPIEGGERPLDELAFGLPHRARHVADVDDDDVLLSLLDDLGVAVAFVLSSERDLVDPLSADPRRGRLPVDGFLHLLDRSPPRAVRRRDRLVGVLDPGPRNGDVPAAGPLEDRCRAPPVDPKRLPNVRLVEVHRQLPLEALFEQPLEVERTRRARLRDVGEVALGLLDDLFALRVEIEAELVVELLGELLGIHSVVLVVGPLLAGFAVLVAVARLWLWVADRITDIRGVASTLTDAAHVAGIVDELREIDDLYRNPDLVGV